jgi:plasmid replication initiation protein
MLHYTGLIRANVPKDNERTSHIEVEIEKKVACLLIEIDMNKQGQPVNYTRFAYEIAQHASSKYTSRIYKLICSWKKKGGFVMRLDDFRQWLGIEGKYKYYNDIKKHILLPVQKELLGKADCWFNCEDAGFALKDGNSVTRLNFKVITPESIEQEGKQLDYIRNMLKNHYYFTDKNLDGLKSILCGSNAQGIITKLLYLSEYISDKNDKITDIPSYVIKTLRNEFEPCQDKIKF